MSAECKVTKGIYMRKYQATNIWEVGGACVEKQRKFGKGKDEGSKFRTMKKISLRNFRKVKFTLRNGVPMAWYSCLPKAISSLFQLQIVHGLKLGFLTSWYLKWYIECRKWTSGSAPKVRRKTAVAVLCFLHFACFSSLLLSFTWLVLMIQKAVKTLKLATNMVRIHC